MTQPGGIIACSSIYQPCAPMVYKKKPATRTAKSKLPVFLHTKKKDSHTSARYHKPPKRVNRIATP